MLTFEKDTHTYKWDGVVKPSYSEIAKYCGLSDVSRIPKRVLEPARAFGESVHMHTELVDRGTIDQYEIDPGVVPCLMAWEEFKSDHQAEIVDIEIAKYHPELQYCGTIDRVMRIGGWLYIIDIKTSTTLYKSYSLQTMAYALLMDEPMRRAVVKLDHKTASYKFVEYQNTDDEATWKHCVNYFYTQDKWSHQTIQNWINTKEKS